MVKTLMATTDKDSSLSGTDPLGLYHIVLMGM